MAESSKKTRRLEDGAGGYKDWESKDVEKKRKTDRDGTRRIVDEDSDRGQSEFHPQADVRETLDLRTKSHLFLLIAIPLATPAIQPKLTSPTSLMARFMALRPPDSLLTNGHCIVYKAHTFLPIILKHPFLSLCFCVPMFAFASVFASVFAFTLHYLSSLRVYLHLPKTVLLTNPLGLHSNSRTRLPTLH